MSLKYFRLPIQMGVMLAIKMQ